MKQSADASWRIVRDASALFIVEVQQKLAPRVADHRLQIRRTEALLTAAALFDIPRLATAHCPQRIGPLIDTLRRRSAPDEIIEKTSFSATDHPRFVERVTQAARNTIVLAGMEAHVCVLLTALGLRAHGFGVCIVADATGSREGRQTDRDLAFARLRTVGCVLTSTETPLFEWMNHVDEPHFRTLPGIV